MRREDLDGSLAHYRLIRKALHYIYNISEADWELLVNLASLNSFTQKDFNEGVVSTSWDRERIARFVKEGYIKQIYRHSGRPGDHSKYQVVLAWRLKVKAMYRMVFDKEPIPETALERCAKTSKSRHLLKRVIQHNKNLRKK